MSMLDYLGRPDFDTANLTTAINCLPHVPKLLGAMGVFQETPIPTTVAKVEKREGKLALLTTAGRGGTMANPRSQPDRKVRTFDLPHVPQYQTIRAEDIQNVRPFGEETGLEMMGTVVNENLGGMKANHEATWEYHRVGAIKGLILDGDASTTIYNLYTEFDVSQPALSWDFSADDPKAAADVIIRTIAAGLGNDMFTGLVGLCGDQFFSALTIHDDVKASYANAASNSWLRAAQLGPEYGPYANGFEWGGILWVNYRGQIGDEVFIPTAESYVFPLGVNQMFQAICGPSDTMDTVNTRGQMLYATREMLPHGLGVELRSTSDCLMMNSRPGAVVKVTGSNLPALPTLS